MTSESYGCVVASEAGFERDCVISRRDLEILLRGSQTEKERGYRNLFAGIAASGGLGTIGTLASHFGELLTVGIDPLESIFLTLMTAATMASSALAAFFHRRIRQSVPDAARELSDHIREQLEHLSYPDDPRHWP